MNEYYTYIYVDPRKEKFKSDIGIELPGEPFYVGKKKKKRAYTHLTESTSRTKNTLKANKIKRIRDAGFEPIIIFAATNVSETEAFDLERSLISNIGTLWNIEGVKRGPLTNQTAGGEGATPSEELKARTARRGSANGMYGKTHTDEAKKRMSRAGTTHTLETKQKMSFDRANGKNYNTKYFHVQFPDGSEMSVTFLKGFCEDFLLNYNTLYGSLFRGTPCKRGTSKGFQILSEISRI